MALLLPPHLQGEVCGMVASQAEAGEKQVPVAVILGIRAPRSCTTGVAAGLPALYHMSTCQGHDTACQ